MHYKIYVLSNIFTILFCHTSFGFNLVHLCYITSLQISLFNNIFGASNLESLSFSLVFRDDQVLFSFQIGPIPLCSLNILEFSYWLIDELSRASGVKRQCHLSCFSHLLIQHIALDLLLQGTQ